MKNKQIILIIVALFIVLICGSSLLYSKLGDRYGIDSLISQSQNSTSAGDAQGSSSQQKTAAPDFTVYDAEGNAVRLSDMRGQPVVLNFWSSRCGPCISEMPHFDKAFTTLGHEVSFMMVNVTDGYWDTFDSASAFIADSGYSFPVYYDTELQASSVYGSSSLPVTFFIDAEGYLCAYQRGAMDMETLIAGIEMSI